MINSDLIADFLEEKKIDTVFGIIGSANAYIFDSIAKKGYTKIVYTHHEQAAVMSAGAYYRASGKLSIAIVTAGGGASNAITGVLSNWADSIPCIILAGQESSFYVKNQKHLRMIGTQGFNASGMVNSIVKKSKCILKKNDVIKSLEEAYYYCLEGRPGPVWLDMPQDIQGAKIDKKDVTHFIPPTPPSYKSEISKITKLLGQSKRPVILAGHGIKLSKSVNNFKELISKLKIPVLTSWLGIDILPENNPYNFGRPGLYGQRKSNFILQNCDLLLVIGSRLSLPLTGYNISNFAPNAKIIMVNNDKDELTKHPYHLSIFDNCSNFINKLNASKWIPSKPISFTTHLQKWRSQCLKYKNKYPTIEPHHVEDNRQYSNSYITVDKISEAADDDAIIVFGQGTPVASGHQAFKVKNNQTVFCSNGLGEMGNGIPSAIGAYFSNPNRQIICLVSDGSLMMNLQELQTIVGYNIPIKFILFNNEGYLFIKHTQKMLFKGNYTGVNKETGVSLPQYKKICKAFGINYTNESHKSIKQFLLTPGSGLYETYMNPEQDLSPKVKGIVTEEGIIAPPLEEMSPLLPLHEIENNMINVNELSYKIKR